MSFAYGRTSKMLTTVRPLCTVNVHPSNTLEVVTYLTPNCAMSRVHHEWPLYITSKRDEAGRKVENEVHINRYTERKASTTTIRLRNQAARRTVLGPLTLPCEPGGANSSTYSPSQRSGSRHCPWEPRFVQVPVTQEWEMQTYRVPSSGGLLFSGVTRTRSPGTTAEHTRAVLSRGMCNTLNPRGSVNTRARRWTRLFARSRSMSALSPRALCSLGLRLQP